MGPAIEKVYGNRVRVRACGLCWNGGDLLVVNHDSVTDSDAGFWAPPGGGIEFGETAAEAVMREFLEETGLEITVQRFRFACEFVKPPLHAVELFFDVVVKGGSLTIGHDPELAVIQDVRFLPFEQLLQMDANQAHAVFKMVKSRSDFENLTGFIPI